MDFEPMLITVVRRVFLFGVLGLLVVLFIGQILSVLGALAILAAVGFLIYLPLHSVIHRQRTQDPLEPTASPETARPLAQASAWVQDTGARVMKGVTFAVAVLEEAGSGAAVGCLLVFLRAQEQGTTHPAHYLMAAGIGAALGLIVALSRNAEQETEPDGNA